MSPTNQPRKDPFHVYSLSPHLPQFQQSAGATPKRQLVEAGGGLLRRKLYCVCMRVQLVNSMKKTVESLAKQATL
jgi:hypothetical protein